MARRCKERASRKFCIYGNVEIEGAEVWGMLTKAFTSHNIIFKLWATKKTSQWGCPWSQEEMQEVDSGTHLRAQVFDPFTFVHLGLSAS